MAKILIVDDDEKLLRAVQVALEGAGHQCITATDGLRGLALARSESPDLILLDLLLPSMDGIKVSCYLKFDRKFRHIPILMLTARAGERERQLSREAGADGFIPKPFRMDELLQPVEYHLSTVVGEQAPRGWQIGTAEPLAG